MKKFILSAIFAVALVSCGGFSTSTEVAQDSTSVADSVVADTLVVDTVVVDTVVAE